MLKHLISAIKFSSIIIGTPFVLGAFIASLGSEFDEILNWVTENLLRYFLFWFVMFLSFFVAMVLSEISSKR